MENTETGSQKKAPLAKIILIAAVALILIGGGYYLYTNKSLSIAPAKTIATVNGEEVKDKEVNARFNQLKPTYESQGVNLADEKVSADIKSKLIDEIVNEVLVVQHAGQVGIAVTDQEVDTALGQIKAGFETEDKYKAELKANNLSESDLRKNVKRDLTIQKFIQDLMTKENVVATEAEITALYGQLAQGRTDVPKLEEVRAQVEQEVKRQKIAQRILAIISELKQKADIKIL